MRLWKAWRLVAGVPCRIQSPGQATGHPTGTTASVRSSQARGRTVTQTQESPASVPVDSWAFQDVDIMIALLLSVCPGAPGLWLPHEALSSRGHGLLTASPGLVAEHWGGFSQLGLTGLVA